MRTVIFARHGETDWSFRSRMQGWALVPLSDSGIQQTKRLAAYLTEQYDTVDKIYASDLPRAQETASMIHTAYRDEPDLQFVEDLREQHYGVLQGLKFSYVLENFPKFDLMKQGKDVLDERPRGGESLNEVRVRVLNFWQQLTDELADTPTGDPVIVVTHTHPLNVLRAEFTDTPFHELIYETEHHPCEIMTVTVDEHGTVDQYTELHRPWLTSERQEAYADDQSTDETDESSGDQADDTPDESN